MSEKLFASRRFCVLALLVQFCIEPRCFVLDDPINHCPDRQIAQNKNSRKDQDRRHAPVQPSVEKICGKIAEIQNESMNGKGYHQGQLLNVIDDIHAACDKGKGGNGKDFEADLIDGQCLQEALLLQNQIENCQNQWAKSAADQASAKKFQNHLFHSPSYLRLISAKHRLETYSR